MGLAVGGQSGGSGVAMGLERILALDSQHGVCLNGL